MNRAKCKMGGKNKIGEEGVVEGSSEHEKMQFLQPLRNNLETKEMGAKSGIKEGATVGASLHYI